MLVLADRGLYARWLFQVIRVCGWHPFLRLNQRGTYCLPGQAALPADPPTAARPRGVWAGRVTCFAYNSVVGTLLACWGAPYREPWFILTDLPPEHSRAAWYGLRSWIEGGFKDLKRDGWDWAENPHDRPRAGGPAVAGPGGGDPVGGASVGGQADTQLPASHLEALPATHIARRTKPHPTPPRWLSCFSRGLLRIVAISLRSARLRWASCSPNPGLEKPTLMSPQSPHFRRPSVLAAS